MISQTFSYNSKLKEFCKFPSELLDEVIGLSIPAMARLCYTKLYDKAKFDPNMCIKISTQQLAKMFGRGVRTIQLHLKLLEQKGFLRRIANFKDDGYQDANTIQILIPEALLKKILKTSDTTSEFDIVQMPEKNFTPLDNNIVVLEEDINNNTEVAVNNLAQKSNVVFSKKDLDLNKWQLAYIMGMLKKVIKSTMVTKELFDQVCFSISSEFQFKGASFKKKVNSIAKLLKLGTWHTPIGFYNHCQSGQERREFYKNLEQKKKWSDDSNAIKGLYEHCFNGNQKKRAGWSSSRLSGEEQEKKSRVTHWKCGIERANGKLNEAIKQADFAAQKMWSDLIQHYKNLIYNESKVYV